MSPTHPSMMSPKIAVICRNTLSVVGLRHILQEVLPLMKVSEFSSMDSLMQSEPESYFHYFVDEDILCAHPDFFMSSRQKTIVLTSSKEVEGEAAGFRSLCVCQPEQQLVKSLLQMEQMAHAHGRNLPKSFTVHEERKLSAREVEVLSLLVQGHINKEIADQLHISLSTVITHRKNITEKLGVKSVSALTIYAVMHGYVDISLI